VQNLLWNSATSRSRGKTSCAVCKTKGVVACPACQGVRVSTSGISSARQQIRKQSAAQDSSPRRTGLITNRCSQCHGKGVVTCTNCSGSGYLHE